MNKKKPNSVYTSTEVRKILGVSASTLKTLSDKGIIEKVTPEGYQHGYYTKKSVNEYSQVHRLFQETYIERKEGKLEVRKALRKDQAAILKMEEEVLGATVPLDKRLEWSIKNPDIDFIATSDDKVTAHISLIPIKKETLTKLLKGEIRGWDVTAEEIETYKPNNQYDLFIMAIATSEKSIHAALILREALYDLVDMATRKILIRAIYATSRTKDGIYLANRIGMKTLEEYSTAHRKVFKLDMNMSETWLAKQYREQVQSLNSSTNPT